METRTFSKKSEQGRSSRNKDVPELVFEARTLLKTGMFRYSLVMEGQQRQQEGGEYENERPVELRRVA